MMKQRIAALLILALTACGGGGGSSAIVPSHSAGGMGSMSVTLKIPAKTHQARAHARKSLAPMYASPATQGLTISFAVAPATPSPSASPDVSFDLSTCTSANNCTQNGDGSRSYTIVTQPVPVGSYNVLLRTWSQPPGTPPAARPKALAVLPPGGAELSDALANVVVNETNTPLNLTLNGIPYTIQAVPIPGQTHVYGDTSSTYDIVGNVPSQWSVVSLDASGYIIAGDGAPLMTLTESTNSLSIAQTSSNLYTITPVKAAASPLTLTVNAQGLGPSGMTATQLSLPITPVQELWQTVGSSILGYLMDPANGYYPPTTTGCGFCHPGFGGNPTDIVTTGGSPLAIAADSAGFLWVYDSMANTLSQYAQRSDGPPQATGVTIGTSGKAIAGLVGDANGYLYGVDQSANALDVWKVVGATTFVTSVALKNTAGFGVTVVPPASAAPASLHNDVLVATSGGVEFYTNASAGTPSWIKTLPGQAGQTGLQAVAVSPDDGTLFTLDTNPTFSSYTLQAGPAMTLQLSYSGGTQDDDAGYLSAGIADYAASSDGTNGTNNNLYQWDSGKGVVNLIFQFQTPPAISGSPWGVLITP